VIEDQRFRHLGGVKDIQVNLRVIAATNRDLSEAVSERRFRLDLYYRLNVIQIHVPPLRERREDILPLANFFIRSFNPRFRRNIRGVSAAGIDELLAHDWPGNVRELRNTIERAMVLEETDWILPGSLAIRREQVMIPAAAVARANSDPGAGRSTEGMSLEEAEKNMLLRALEKTAWNQTRAAKVLEITRDTLRYKMKKFNLRPPQSTSD
jgi:DNA-binding NtrC family response regulator